VRRVRGGVLLHPLGKRALGPIGALELLGELEAQVLLHDAPQPQRALAQERRGDLRVEQVGHRQAGVAVQDAQVVVRVVEHGLHGGIFQEVRQRVQDAHRERVDQEVLLARGDLHQAHPVEEPVVACRLRVDRDQGKPAQPLYGGPEPFRGVDVFVFHLCRGKRRAKIALRAGRRKGGRLHRGTETKSSLCLCVSV